MASFGRNVALLSTVLVLLAAIFRGSELFKFPDKTTARLTALFRYSATFYPVQFPKQVIDNDEEILIGYDNYAQYFSFQTINWLFSSSAVRWIWYEGIKQLPINFGGVVAHTIGRHIIIDEVVLNEIQTNNAKQLVILGAGYDSRAFRFEYLIKKYNVDVFEVDLPTTQSTKKSLLKVNKIKAPTYVTFVEIDFEENDINQTLRNNGYDPTKQTVFVFEGVSMYLTATDVSNVLNLVSQFSGDNSLIVWDIVHFCLLNFFGLGRLADTNVEKYCDQNGMLPSWFGSILYHLFSMLGEPLRFALDWDLNDEKSTKQNLNTSNTEYNYLLDFHKRNCLQTERIYAHNEIQKYFETKEPNQTLLYVSHGMSVTSARKIDDCIVD